MDDCGTCQKEVEQEERPFMCDLCEGWEHVACVRECDRPCEALYDALASCRSKSLGHRKLMCAVCQKKVS